MGESTFAERHKNTFGGIQAAHVTDERDRMSGDMMELRTKMAVTVYINMYIIYIYIYTYVNIYICIFMFLYISMFIYIWKYIYLHEGQVSGTCLSC